MKITIIIGIIGLIITVLAWTGANEKIERKLLFILNVLRKTTKNLFDWSLRKTRATIDTDNPRNGLIGCLQNIVMFASVLLFMLVAAMIVQQPGMGILALAAPAVVLLGLYFAHVTLAIIVGAPLFLLNILITIPWAILHVLNLPGKGVLSTLGVLVAIFSLLLEVIYE